MLGCALTLAIMSVPPAAAAAPAAVVALHAPSLSVEIDRASGSVVRLVSLRTGWSLVDPSLFGERLSFRALLPLGGGTPPDTTPPRRRRNYVHGTDQAAPTITANATDVELVWAGVKSEHGGFHAGLTISLGIHVHGEGLHWTSHIDNQANETVENFYWPYLSVRPPGSDYSGDGGGNLEAFFPSYSDPSVWQLFPNFRNGQGYFGTNYEVQMDQDMQIGTPFTPFALLRDPGGCPAARGCVAPGTGCGTYADSCGQGFYVGVADSDLTKSGLVAWMAEMRAGWLDSIEQMVPPQGQHMGSESSVRWSPVHMPYVLPGTARRLTPIQIEHFEGGWQIGVDIYKRWLKSWMILPELPQWVQEPHSWQQIQLNDPEDKEGVNYTQFKEIGKTAAKWGVQAIQVTGWHIGGQDQAYPDHSIDPRLGTFEEFAAAIKYTQALGVKVILFTKYLWADQAMDWFRHGYTGNEADGRPLRADAIKDPYQDYYQGPGYRYGTATQWADIDTKRLIPMCWLEEHYQRVMAEQFAKELSLQPDGILQDECQHHSAHLCFDHNHSHRFGASAYEQDRKLIANFSQQAREARRDMPGQEDLFLFAGESPYHWEFEQYHMGYFRTATSQHRPTKRYILPDRPLSTAIVGYNDRNMLNQCLMYRYIPSFEPLNFHGSLDLFPETMRYGQALQGLRTTPGIREYVWDGEFRHELGATALSGGGDLMTGRYAVFKGKHWTPGSGDCAVVVATYADSENATVRIWDVGGECGGGRGGTRSGLGECGRWRLVDNETWVHWDNVTAPMIVVPPRSAAVLVPCKPNTKS